MSEKKDLKEKNKMENTKKTDQIVIDKKKLYKILKIILPIILIICILCPSINYLKVKSQSDKLYNVKNIKHLEKLLVREKPKYNFSQIFLTAFSWLDFIYYRQYDYPYYLESNRSGGTIPMPDSVGVRTNAPTLDSKDYSTTNIQVENVDEADIIKTDGNFVYSISESDVVITDVRDRNNPKVMAKIASPDNLYPMDILIKDKKILIISVDSKKYGYDFSTTNISIYDINNLSDIKKVKTLNINGVYNTSRMIGDKVYLFANLSVNSNRNIHTVLDYKEDFKDKKIDFEKVKYIKNDKSRSITTFISLDLSKAEEDVKISSYLVPLNIAYISENNIYILNGEYNYSLYDDDSSSIPLRLKEIFLKGMFGLKNAVGYYDSDLSWSNSRTKIAKYKIAENGEIEFVNNTTVKGKALNQYSCDEKDGNLRIALNDNNGTKILVLDENLKEIGDTGSVAKGEDNKSVRFAGNRAYFVTYKNVDPLYAIDLTNPRDPKIMGELKIPGFSTYLHPYDDNHIIGIGQATNEEIMKDEFGRPINEVITFNGMKMSLFDISDMKNPKQKDVVYFGDRDTSSPIHKNAKALLFSKEKNLIAIPISGTGNISAWTDQPIPGDEAINSPGTNPTTSAIAPPFPVVKQKIREGYIVYSLNLDGFKYRAIITHDFEEGDYDKNYARFYTKQSTTMRGLYIGDNLLTVSERALKINDLNTLDFISNIDIKKGDQIEKELGNTILRKED